VSTNAKKQLLQLAFYSKITICCYEFLISLNFNLLSTNSKKTSCHSSLICVLCRKLKISEDT